MTVGNNEIAEQQKKRLQVMMSAIAVAFLVLALQLLRLQIVEHEEFLIRSQENAMRTVPIDPPRGRLLDRYGKVIVGNRPAYTISVIPAEVRNPDHMDSVLSVNIGISPGTLLEKIKGNRRLHRPVDLRKDAPFAAVAYVEEHRHELPGIIYVVETRRRYPYAVLGAHMLGYVRELKDSQLERLRDQGYYLGDMMGQSGLEAQYETELRGIPGDEYQEVTAAGRVVDSHRREPVRGSDLRLGIDLALQIEAERAMDSLMTRGGVVAMDPRTGEILVMASRPAYDPAVFAGVVPSAIWRAYNDNEERPMFNRAIQGGYPPGSTAKMASAVAGMTFNVIDSTTHLGSCGGGYYFGRRYYKCWKKGGHGSLVVANAIERSCNVFFYQVGQRLGLARWGEVAKRFGLGSKTGVDIPSESPGIIASPEVYDRRLGPKRWGHGEALNAAIGQGITVVTPIQMVRYVAALGTGILPQPHFAMGVIDPNGVEKTVRWPAPVALDVRPDIQAVVRYGMALVTGPGGTARRARVPGYVVAGKTGTAQNPHGKDHSWFVAFAPAENPVIAIAVIAENAGHGSDVAAPVAGHILRSYLLRPPGGDPPSPLEGLPGVHVAEADAARKDVSWR